MPSPAAQPNEQPESARAILAENVIRLRRQKGWSQEGLAHETGLHRTFIAHIERRVRNISLDNIEKLAAALGVATYALLTPYGRCPGANEHR